MLDEYVVANGQDTATRGIQVMPVKGQPYAHQQKAYDFIRKTFGLDGYNPAKGKGAALLMEMGTGKTLVAIAATGCLSNQGKAARVLIVAPLPVLGVWEQEFEKFADFPYTLTVLRGTTSKKKAQLKNIDGDGLQVVVTNYDCLSKLATELAAYKADLVIADEGHKIKDSRTKRSKAMHKLGDLARYKLLLTGTLITNREMDVFSQYRFIDHTVFGKYFLSFRDTYFDMIGYGNHTPVFREDKKEDFLNTMHSVAFRVTKAECLDLPAVTEEERVVELEPKAMKKYLELERTSQAQLEDSNKITAQDILTRLLRLSQFTGGYLPSDDGNEIQVSQAKLDALAEIIRSAVNENKKIVVMAKFSAEINAITKLLEDENVKYALLCGKIKDKDGKIKRFQEEKDCLVFVGQIDTAALGITLTAASTMVFFSLDYSMSNFKQAKARINRSGQTENCHYIYLLAKDTVDAKVLETLRNKMSLAKMLLDEYRKGQNPFSASPSGHSTASIAA